VFCIVGYEYSLLAYCELVHTRIIKATVFEIVCNVLDIKLTIEKEKGCPMGHVFIEEQFMFVKPFRHEV
jgi:hypothetical protein